MDGDEHLVAAVLVEMGYHCEPFSKEELRMGIKTPDFRVYDGNELAFFCEVKTFTDASTFNDRCRSARPGEVIEEFQMGPAKGNRLENQMRYAAKKFQDVNPAHSIANVVVIVNRDELFFSDDIRELVEGYVMTPRGCRAHTISKAPRNRFHPDCGVIDAYLVLKRIKDTGEAGSNIYCLENAVASSSIVLFLDRYATWMDSCGNASRL